MELKCKIDGIPIVLRCLRKLRDKFEFSDEASEEFKLGVFYGIDSIIVALEKWEVSDND